MRADYNAAAKAVTFITIAALTWRDHPALKDRSKLRLFPSEIKIRDPYSAYGNPGLTTITAERVVVLQLTTGFRCTAFRF
jgi:hypothetical protein